MRTAAPAHDRWITLDAIEGETLRSALERALRDAIATGGLREGVSLPSSRWLAADLGVSRGVVTDAYAQLEAQGFLSIGPRRPPVVATGRHPRAAALPGGDAVRRPLLYDLTPTSPDVTLFPLTRWLTAMQTAARRAGAAMLEYRQPCGELALRSALADHLSRTRGVIADPDDIVIVQGTAQGVDLMLRVLLRRGRRRLAVEDPSHSRQQERARELGFELRAHPVDDDGMVVDGLAADAVLVTPAHQFPAGSVMSGVRRRQLLTWARETDGLIIEDDYDSEFRYDREPVRALQGVAPDRVVQLGTVSKTLAPALRLGWVVLPRDLAGDAAHVKRLVDDFSPALDQLALAELLTSGRYYRHLRRARAVYAKRRDALRAALARHLPTLQTAGVSAGLHLLLRLPPDVDDTTITDELLHRRVGVTPLSALAVGETRHSGLVIGYGRLHESAADAAVRRIADVLVSCGAVEPDIGGHAS